MTVIIFLIVLGILILSHELGHFIVAKWAGLRVDEFGLGFPPRLWSYRRGETLYSLNLIPFGGFVKIYGEDPEETTTGATAKDQPRALTGQSKWVQAATLVAGIAFNLILAWFLITAALATTGLPTSASAAPRGYQVQEPRLTIVSVADGSPAAAAGLKVGDVIASFRSRSERLEELSPETVREFTAGRSGQEIIVGYRRTHPGIKPTLEEIAVIPTVGLALDRPSAAAIGVGLETVGILKLSWPRAILVGGQMSARLVYLTGLGLINLFGGIFSGQGEILNQVTGPIGLATLVGTASALGFGYLLLFTAIISINLAILNLLPFPALDGGRLFFLLIEAIKGSPIRPKIVNTLNLLGFALLIILMLAVTYGDIVKIVKN
ncbi:MAG: M50 family metallopeptidase, partial [Patescibacteria group bacterium]